MWIEISKDIEVNIDNQKKGITLRNINSDTLEFKYFFMTLEEAKKICEVIK